MNVTLVNNNGSLIFVLLFPSPGQFTPHWHIVLRLVHHLIRWRLNWSGIKKSSVIWLLNSVTIHSHSCAIDRCLLTVCSSSSVDHFTLSQEWLKKRSMKYEIAMFNFSKVWNSGLTTCWVFNADRCLGWWYLSALVSAHAVSSHIYCQITFFKVTSNAMSLLYMHRHMSLLS